MDISGKIMATILIFGLAVLIFDILGVFDLIKNFRTKRSDSPGRVTGLPLIRGDKKEE